MREEIDKRRTRVSTAVDMAGRILSQPSVFVLLVLFHLGWIVLNLHAFPGVAPWDPSPFTLLATIASSLAPMLSLMILMRQQRDTRIAELRQEINLQVCLQIERKLTHTLRMVDQMRHRLDVYSAADTHELDQLKHFLDAQDIMERVRQHLDDAEGPME